MTLDELRENIRIEDYVAERVEGLTRVGANFTACCPFHSEKTPSFVVSPDKQIFKCFGCGKGGDIFTFIRELDGVGFRQALTEAGSFIGVEVENAAPSKKEPIYQTLQQVTRFFQKKRKSIEFKRFVKERGLNKEVVAAFGLGFAPVKYTLPTEKDDLLAAGLINDQGRNKFVGRIMFPIIDHYGKTVGFTGRDVLGLDKRPKYLNSPETKVFRKKELLYGMYQARNHIRETGQAILVEGQMDVISFYMAGIKNVVASSGTAFSVKQAEMIAKHAKSVVICYDGDKAGREATLKAANMLLQQGLFVYIADIPEGKDPADMENKDLHTLINHPIEWISYIWNSYSGAEGQIEAARRIVTVLSTLENVEQDLYLRRAEDITGIEYDRLLKSTKKKHKYVKRRKVESKLLDEQMHLLHICVNHPEYGIRILVEEFKVRDFYPELRPVVQILFDLAGQETELTHNSIYSLFDREDIREELEIITTLLMLEDNPSNKWGIKPDIEYELMVAVRNLKIKVIDRKIERIRRKTTKGNRKKAMKVTQDLLQERKDWLYIV